MAKLICEICGEELDVPVHCGKKMHKQGDQLVCWMGPACGEQPIPEHCGETMMVQKS